MSQIDECQIVCSSQELYSRITAIEARLNLLEAKKRASKKVLTDEEWFKSLKDEPLYKGINIDLEFQKCQAWCKPRNRQATRRTFVNWLIKAVSGAPINGNGKPIVDGAREELLSALKNTNNKVMPVLYQSARDLFYAQGKKWHDLQREVQSGIIAF